MANKDLLEQRKQLKSKKPVFVRQDHHKKPKISEVKWRRPKGLQSKMRLCKRGYRRTVEIGWGSPGEVRGLNRSGLQDILVHSRSDLEGLDPKKNSLILGSGVGMRGKMQIIEDALKGSFMISNIKDPKKYLEEVKAEVKKRKEDSDQRKQDRSAKREKDKKEAEKKRAEKEKQEAEKTAEEKKAEEKQEKDSVLTAGQ